MSDHETMDSGRPISVAAVVITHNRLALLQECLSGIRVQTRRPDEIIVIDNGSSDGTAAWLEQQTDITTIRQANLGGAGGFHTGVKTAYELGHDWLWCMDDDGLPAPDCLERLLGVREIGLRFRSPLVVDRAAPESLAHDWRSEKTNSILTTRSAAVAAAENGLLPGAPFPFNGSLFHREAVQKIGFPNADLFQWGDDSDYFLRAKQRGIPWMTVVDALFLHPKSRILFESVRVFGCSISVPYVGKPLKDYLLVRNNVYLARQYEGRIVAARRMAKFGLFYALHSGPGPAVRALRYAWEGVTGNLKGHQTFLGR